jgi:hypothetical protein
MQESLKQNKAFEWKLKNRINQFKRTYNKCKTRNNTMNFNILDIHFIKIKQLELTYNVKILK